MSILVYAFFDGAVFTVSGNGMNVWDYVLERGMISICSQVRLDHGLSIRGHPVKFVWSAYMLLKPRILTSMMGNCFLISEIAYC